MLGAISGAVQNEVLWNTQLVDIIPVPLPPANGDCTQVLFPVETEQAFRCKLVTVRTPTHISP